MVPACNEVETLEPLDALRGEGYPNVEYVLVDDRSTEGTSEIVDRLAAEDNVAVLAAGAGPWRMVGGLAALLLLGTQWTVCRWLRRPWLPTVFAPIRAILVIFGAARSMVVTRARGGVEWRGTRYSLAALRAGMRFTLE